MKKKFIQIGLILATMYPPILLTLVSILLPRGAVRLAIMYLALAMLVAQLFFSKRVCGTYKRLSTNFVAIRIPFTGCSLITQIEPRGADAQKSCRTLFRSLLAERDRMLSRLDAGRFYIATTHQTVIDRLKESDVMDEQGLRCQRVCYRSSLEGVQSILLGKARCNKSCDVLRRERCVYRKIGLEQRDFYLILFRTGTEQFNK